MKETDEEEYHRTQDTTGRCKVDQLLRDHGFSIFSRKKNAEPVWKKHGQLYPQEEALVLIKWSPTCLDQTS